MDLEEEEGLGVGVGVLHGVVRKRHVRRQLPQRLLLFAA